jgi:lipopolysaccharide biosynthesis regulator YciM
MTSKTTRTIAGAILGGAVAFCGTAYAAQTITNRAVGVPLQAAVEAQKAGNTGVCIAKAQEADKVAGKSAYESTVINQLITACAIQAGNNQLALTMLDKMIAAGQGNKTENLKQAMNISLRMKNNAKAQQYLNQLGGAGGNAALLMGQAQYQAGNYDEAIRLARPMLQQGTPSKDLLELLSAAYYKKGDEANRRLMLEQLTLHYPSAEYWHNLLQMARNQKGLNDEQQLQIMRLRLLVGDIKTGTEFSEMAQLAIIAGYPAEAKAVLMKASEAKQLEGLGERGQRLVNLTAQRVAADEKQLAAMQAQAPAAAAGDAEVKLGKVLLSYDKAADAEKAIRAGIAKGKLTDEAGAKIALGRALLAQGKKQDAVRQFNAVPRNSDQAAIARLWSIYAQRA